ncbi:uncharacterized [Lates japonicus]
MPIASGAAGRVDVGVNTTSVRTHDGLRGKPKANRNRDSYLQRYQELKQCRKNKMNALQGTQDNTDENDGAKVGNPPMNGDSEGHASGKPASGERSKKSRLCVLL